MSNVVVLANDTIRVVRDELPGRIVREVEQVTRVLAVAKQGPIGPIGPSGAPYMVCVADVALSGHRAVRGVFDDRVQYASSANVAPVDRVLGITLGAALAGGVINVQTNGKIVEPSWAWLPDLPIFLGLDGVLTQTAPTIGVSQVLAFAVAPTVIVVQIHPPVVLA